MTTAHAVFNNIPIGLLETNLKLMKSILTSLALFLFINLNSQSVPSGTYIPMKLTERIVTDRHHHKGDVVKLIVESDIVVKDSIMIKSGTPVYGIIKEYKIPNTIGKPGEIYIQIDIVKDVKGNNVKLYNASIIEEGEDKKALSIGLA